MGKTVSIYLDDQHLQQLAKYPNISKVVKKALDQFFKTDQRQEGFDKVLKAAKEIGDAPGFDEAVKEWEADRSSDRW